MSTKKKICQPALTSHIEICHEQCSFTPLVVSRSLNIFRPEYKGIKALVNSEITKSIDSEIAQLVEENRKAKVEIKAKMSNTLNCCSNSNLKSTENEVQVKQEFLTPIYNELDNQLQNNIDYAQKEVVNKNKEKFDLTNPEKIIETKEISLRDAVDQKDFNEFTEVKIPFPEVKEYDGLGLFFKEDVCYRGEGLSYSPCGKEFTIMPGERFNESNTIEIKTEDKETGEIVTTQNLTNKQTETEDESFTNSYERNLRKETDIKLSRQASFKASIPFKIFNLDLSGSSTGSINFNRILKEVNKSSHTTTRKRFSEVVRQLMTRNTQTSSSSVKSSQTIAHSRVWENTTDSPMHFIKRTSFCKTSVLHKRHNVQLAWNGCIDNPSEGLCTGDNIEERMASEIQSVRDKWSQTSAPVEFGPRPSNKKHCSGIHNYVSSIGSKKYIPVNDTIPADYYYDGGAQLEIVSSTTTPQSSYISSEPSSGAEGGVTFGTYVDVQNRALHTERATFKVCYLIAPKAAKEWDDKLNQWRDEQAQLEIDDLLIEKKEELNRFLASDQARATIERRIMEDFFGVTPIQDCGALITRLRRLFDFDSMCFSLLPSWNEMGEGCQKAFPVTLYTAKCLHFYLPIKEGMELEASILLASVNAIGWNSQFVPQLMTYINQIDNMRSTLYNRAFDPTGWDVKFDQPNGYDITPYDSNSPNWSAAHESDLNYELLGAFTINVPCGERVDPRPGLCGNEGQ